MKSIDRTYEYVVMESILFIGGCFFAIVFYPEPFSLIEDAISELGSTVTDGGQVNTISPLFFAGAFLGCAIVFWAQGSHYRGLLYLPHRKLKVFLTRIGAVGALIAIVPFTVSHPLHSLGCGLFVFSLWMMGNLHLIEIHSYINKLELLILTLLLQGTVLPYAYLFAIDSPVKQPAQKIAIAGIIISSLYSSYIVSTMSRKIKAIDHSGISFIEISAHTSEDPEEAEQRHPRHT